MVCGSHHPPLKTPTKSAVRGSLHSPSKIWTESAVRRSLHPPLKFGPNRRSVDLIVQWSLVLTAKIFITEIIFSDLQKIIPKTKIFSNYYFNWVEKIISKYFLKKVRKYFFSKLFSLLDQEIILRNNIFWNYFFVKVRK